LILNDVTTETTPTIAFPAKAGISANKNLRPLPAQGKQFFKTTEAKEEKEAVR